MIIHSGMNEMMIRYSAPTSVMRVRISLMWSAVRLPGRMPGINPPYFLILSATSLGLKTIET